MLFFYKKIVEAFSTPTNIIEPQEKTRFKACFCTNLMFAMAKIMEMETAEQNKVALYLFNNIKAI